MFDIHTDLVRELAAGNGDQSGCADHQQRFDGPGDEQSAVPRNRDYRHDNHVTADGDEDAVPQNRGYRHDSDVMSEIEGRLARIQAQLEPYERLVAERDRLQRVRAALVGDEPIGSPTRGQGVIRRRDVHSHLLRHPGSRPIEIARGLGVRQPTISAHLYRGKGEHFARSGGRWFALTERAGAEEPIGTEVVVAAA